MFSFILFPEKPAKGTCSVPVLVSSKALGAHSAPRQEVFLVKIVDIL